MKLAEALLERKSIKEQISSLRERARQDARVQEGDEPSELPESLVAEIETLLVRFEELIILINKTNLTARLSGGQSLMEAIARRDMLKMHHQLIKDLADAASPERDIWRQTRSEIKFKPTIDVADWRRKADKLAKEYREIDNQLQAANWTVEISE